ncbi:MAG: ABC transporter permease [Desulfuromonadaceae bacterium]|nr:ABC transporter permease [Desulfuromonadaceae bacterium]
MLDSLWHHRQLIVSLVRREVVGRYRGSVLGLLWSFFNPVFMLAVYTFVFSVVFKARWSVANESRAEFALVLFAGLIFFNFFAECLNRAPGLILANANYVKKVVFPLEVLCWVSCGSALFHALVSLVVWLLFYLVVVGVPPLSVLLFPLVLLPLVLLTMGLSWLLASLGVFLRDVSQIIGIVMTILLFLTPIFYPLTAIPEQYRGYVYANPMTFIIEQARDLLCFHQPLHWPGLGLLTLIALVVAWGGFAWFQKTRKGFADVL